MVSGRICRLGENTIQLLIYACWGWFMQKYFVTCELYLLYTLYNKYKYFIDNYNQRYWNSDLKDVVQFGFVQQ